MQKFIEKLLAFGKNIPHEREVGIALIILGIGLILFFQVGAHFNALIDIMIRMF
jgi:hypothetical protein